MIVGYARTSTTDQKAGLEAQIRDLQAAGAETIFSEQVSSMAEREQLQAALSSLSAGDALMVSKPDRLARSTLELLAIEKDLSARNVGLILLSMGGERLDTRNPTSKLILTILAGVATWEREIMLERQREGIAAAKAAGKYPGRAPSLDGEAVLALYDEDVPPEKIAKKLGMSRASVYRLIKSSRAARMARFNEQRMQQNNGSESAVAA
jgi:DNA invertase Pin-like site-specific DNA recombinase